MNKKELNVTMPQMKSVALQEKLVDKSFTAQPSEYVATPAICKDKFAKIQTSLRNSLARFQTSGQGNCQHPRPHPRL